VVHAKPLSIAVIGNPNVGKSVLFNSITGSTQVIGNWCGKTTEACTVQVEYGGRLVNFTDLPGIYGFGFSSKEEHTVDRYLQTQSPDLVMVVVDAQNLERNLFLVLETIERFGKSLVILNKLDAAAEHGMVIDHAKLAELLGVPVIPAIATGKLPVKDMFQAIFAVTAGGAPFPRINIEYPSSVGTALAAQPSPTLTPAASAHWLALKQVEQQSEDLQIAIINARYEAAANITSLCMVHHPTESLSDKIDYWALHRYAGVPIMVAVFALLFFLTFTVSRPLSELIGEGFDLLREALHALLPAWGTPDYLTSLIADGLVSGIGATLGFLPQIAFFYLVYHLIQDSGYIIRVAFLMDRLMSAIGLNGKIFIPLVAGYSCNVNGILASRMLTSRYDRMVAVLASSFAPCSARIGVMVFMVSAFFPSSQATVVMLVLLAISTAMMAVIAFLVRLFMTPDESSTFLTEVPVYVLPNVRHLLISTAGRTLHFLKRIKNVIIYSSVIMWVLTSYPTGPFEATYIARIGKALAPVGSLLGLDWQLIVALIAGIPAKESALTALGIIFQANHDSGNLAQVLSAHISPLAAFTFLVVYMTYIPCLATVITIYQEMKNWTVAIFSVWGSVLLSFLLGAASYHIGRFFF